MPKTVKTFENKLEMLEEIVSKLERGEAPLGECMEMYEITFCLHLLSHKRH